METEIIKRVLGKNESIALLERLSKLPHVQIQKHENKLSTCFIQNEKQIMLFKRPLLFPEIEENCLLTDYLEKLEKLEFSHLILLMQAGNAALAYFNNDALEHHKVIRKYMVRKSQGKAQIKHLKTKGKSRLGSRIRLQQSEKFFEEIHEKIREWQLPNNFEKLLYSCDISLWSLLFEKKYQPAFDKNDSRLQKIPLDLEVPNMSVINYVHKFAYKSYVEGHSSLIE